jgi:hypothetical protein
MNIQSQILKMIGIKSQILFASLFFEKKCKLRKRKYEWNYEKNEKTTKKNMKKNNMWKK